MFSKPPKRRFFRVFRDIEKFQKAQQRRFFRVFRKFSHLMVLRTGLVFFLHFPKAGCHFDIFYANGCIVIFVFLSPEIVALQLPINGGIFGTILRRTFAVFHHQSINT